MSACVQVFGRRNAEPVHALSRPASEKRQRTNPLPRERAARGAGASGTDGVIKRAG